MAAIARHFAVETKRTSRIFISVVERDYQGKAGQVSVTVNITEGQQWIVDKLTVNGVVQENANAVLSRLASGDGQPFADTNLAADRDVVLTQYFRDGFPNADFKAEWSPSGEPNHVNVVYTITEGSSKYVRDVVTSGLSVTRRSLVDRNITLKPGEPLSPLEETEIQKRFYDLGIFARVDTAIQNPEGDEDHKYVIYNFQEANRYSLSVGFGAQVARFGTPSTNSVSSAAGTTGFSPQISADITRLNFLGLGHTVSL